MQCGDLEFSYQGLKCKRIWSTEVYLRPECNQMIFILANEEFGQKNTNYMHFGLRLFSDERLNFEACSNLESTSEELGEWLSEMNVQYAFIGTSRRAHLPISKYFWRGWLRGRRQSSVLADHVSDDTVFIASPDSWLTSTSTFGNGAVVVVAGDVWQVARPNISSWKHGTIKCSEAKKLRNYLYL